MQTRFSTTGKGPKCKTDRSEQEKTRSRSNLFRRVEKGCRNAAGVIAAVASKVWVFLKRAGKTSSADFDIRPWMIGLAAGALMAVSVYLFVHLQKESVLAGIKKVEVIDEGMQVSALTHTNTVGELYKALDITLGVQDVTSAMLSDPIEEGKSYYIRRAMTVYITENAKVMEPIAVEVLGGTVSDALAQSPYRNAQMVSPSRQTPLVGGLLITVSHAETKMLTERESIPFSIREEDDSSMFQGTQRVRSEGKEGEKQITYEVVYVDGEETSRTIVSEEILQPSEDRVIAVGVKKPATPKPSPTRTLKKTAQKTATKSPTKTNMAGTVDTAAGTVTVGAKTYTIKEEMVVEITAYTHTGNTTATGKWPQVGMMAVDKSVIPLGTIAYVPGYGIAVAEDVGVGGNQIDIFMETRDECIQWGRKRNVTIYILEE